MRKLLHDVFEQTRGRPLLRIMLVVYLLIPVVLTVIAVYSVVQRGQINDLARRIQASRIEATRRACDDQNARHDDTIHKLDALLAKVPPDRRAAAQASRGSTVLLIEALVPHRDCDVAVDRIRLG